MSEEKKKQEQKDQESQKKEARPVEDLTFEEALDELEAIVNQLQNGNVPLKESMDAFQRGVALANYCSQSLDQAETTMTKLMTDSGELKDLDAQSDEDQEVGS